MSHESQLLQYRATVLLAPRQNFVDSGLIGLDRIADNSLIEVSLPDRRRSSTLALRDLGSVGGLEEKVHFSPQSSQEKDILNKLLVSEASWTVT